MLRDIFTHTKARKQDQRKADFQRALLHYEARLGGEIFGPIPKGGRREFFCLDEHTWVWHEEWKDEQGKQHALTTRYDIRPNGVVKSQGDSVYQALTKEEAHNFYLAMQAYVEKVNTELQRIAQYIA
ncbi:MAG TPA: hypothetical protein VFT53_02315 [Candidatus Saccharimonadales bacterium]|nr:hypothetical protein [Candidatus Saccharimonadales bacterium]